MSVIPQEESLVISFQDAARLFNANAAPPTPNEIGRGELLRQPSQAPSTTAALVNPFDPTTSTAEERLPAVVPAPLPLREHAALNPDALIDLRHPVAVEGIGDAGEYEPRRWVGVREKYRIYFAEFLGTMVLVLWGEGTQAQVVAARQVPNDYLSIAWGWGVGFLLAIYLSSGISGGHINPAVTISLAIFRGFSWRKVPGYIVAQVLGGFAGAAVIYGVYYGPLTALEGGYASVLTTGPSALLPSVASSFFSVFTGAALLMGAISVFTDTGNNPASPGMTPLLLGLIMVGIASSFGYQTGFVLNPARDLGPRFHVWATGYSGRDLWLDNSAYGIWTPTVGTIAGALFGNFIYDVLLYTGRDSPVNYKRVRKHRVRHQKHVDDEKDELRDAELGQAGMTRTRSAGGSTVFDESQRKVA